MTEELRHQPAVDGDPSDTDIERLLAPLDPDDDIAERVEACDEEIDGPQRQQ